MSDGAAPPRRTAGSSSPVLWIVVALVAAVALVAIVLALTGDDEPAQVVRSPGASSGPSEATRVALVVAGGLEPYVAVVGSGGSVPPGALVLPADTTVVVPGAGELTIGQVAALPLEDMQVGVSNAVGAWEEEAARIDLAAILTSLGAVGGLEVNLPSQTTLGDESLGPGPASLDVPQIEELLTQRSEDPELRWKAVLTAISAQPDLWPAPAEATDPQVVASILGGAREVEPVVAPTEVLAGTLRVPSQPAFDETVQDLFGTEPPIPVEVRNGTGTPGIGSAVGAAIVPEGFRVVLSGNAESFDVTQTEIVANGPDTEAAAQAIRQALGVGAVRVSQVPSGIADVTVIVGADYTP